MFEKGQKVKLIASVMGIKTEYVETVLRVDKKGVWLDNGPGNDPSGPYDSLTGQWADNGIIPMSTQKIVPVEG